MFDMVGAKMSSFVWSVAGPLSFLKTLSAGMAPECAKIG
jgi:hypothetical protein